MKYQETKFEDYINSCKNSNLHKECSDTLQLVKNPISNQNNLIFYGPSGIGKYTQALNFIKDFSKTGLKYERKINFSFQNKKTYLFKISDIHYEVDMELLGCNAKLLWNDFFNHIIDILSASQDHTGIILCKNFHKIHSELLDIFYSYMQTLSHKNINLIYILITEDIGFIPTNILNRCQVLPFKRPTKQSYKKITGKTLNKNYDISNIINIKNINSNILQLQTPNKIIVNKIINNITNYKELKFMKLREQIYEMFIYQLNVNYCIWDIINHFINNKKINNNNIHSIFNRMFIFFKYYNNNYRPIYHIEGFLYYLCTVIHGL
uniref:Uncharacterized protein n=1 Tax=viral metagenome TaxID=1070528 RepID=A0A6C0AK27_9ZZZZ